MMDMRRRDFIAGLAGAIAWPMAARAQEPAVPVVGFLRSSRVEGFADLPEAVRTGLRESGYEVGRNVAIEYRWAEGQFERLPAMAADLVSRKVAVICAGAPDVAIRAAMAATKTIPNSPAGLSKHGSVNPPIRLSSVKAHAVIMRASPSIGRPAPASMAKRVP